MRIPILGLAGARPGGGLAHCCRRGWRLRQLFAALVAVALNPAWAFAMTDAEAAVAEPPPILSLLSAGRVPDPGLMACRPAYLCDSEDRCAWQSAGGCPAPSLSPELCAPAYLCDAEDHCSWQRATGCPEP